MSFHFALTMSGTLPEFMLLPASLLSPGRSMVCGRSISASDVRSVGSEAMVPVPRIKALRPRWSIELELSAEQVRALRPGWDGPGSGTVDSSLIDRAVALTRAALVDLVNPSAPYLMPGADGSLQIEWDRMHAKLEFYLEPDGSVDFWSRDLRSGAELEGEGAEALALFRRWAPWAAQAAGADHADHGPGQKDMAVFELAA